MLSLRLLLAAVSLSPSVFAAQVQKQGLKLPPGANATRSQVQQIFVNVFHAYTEFAFGHDDLKPVSKSFLDESNGWGASIVNSLSTMKVMGLDDLFQTAVNFTSHINFNVSNTPDPASVFESTISHVGSLLSAYELNGNQPQVLVDKAKQLVDQLKQGFSGAVAVPFDSVNIATGKPVVGTTNIADAGTLTLEWATLSKHTGDDTYRQLAEGAAKHIAQLPPPLPGLAAQDVDPSTGNAVGGYVTWGDNSGEYFEYLVKYARLNPSADPVFIQTWKTAVDSSIKYLLKTSSVGNYSYLAEFGFQNDRQIRHVGSHAACFAGANWILGGKLLNNQTIVNLGLELVDACWNTYAATATGLGPSLFGFISKVNGQPPNGTDDGSFTGSPITAADKAFNNKHGFYILDGGAQYVLRGELVESNFYAWRATGNPKYLANAQSVVQSLLKFLEVPGGDGGVSGLNDVNNATTSNANRLDDTGNFFFAEMMKYLYLTFDDPSHISIDDYVFNTESHVFKAQPFTGF